MIKLNIDIDNQYNIKMLIDGKHLIPQPLLPREKGSLTLFI